MSDESEYHYEQSVIRSEKERPEVNKPAVEIRMIEKPCFCGTMIRHNVRVTLSSGGTLWRAQVPAFHCVVCGNHEAEMVLKGGAAIAYMAVDK